MQSQEVFEPESDLSDEERRWADYCRAAQGVDPEAVLSIVLDELRTREASELLDFICSVQKTPYRDDERVHMSHGCAIRMGQDIAQLVAQAYDDQVNMRQYAR